MKSSKILLTSAILLLALVVTAQAAWTPAPANPPDNNAPEPINVTASTQTKNGLLQLKALISPWVAIGDAIFSGKFQITENSEGKDKVLASKDEFGNAVWKTLSELCTSTGACGGDSFWKLLPNNNIGNTNSNKGVEIEGVLLAKQAVLTPSLAAGDSIFSGKFQITNNSEGKDKVLASIDEFGNAKWVATSTILGPNPNYWSIDAGNNISNNNPGDVGVKGNLTVGTIMTSLVGNITGLFMYNPSYSIMASLNPPQTNFQPAAGKILSSIDDNGTAVWADFSNLYQKCIDAGSCPGGDSNWAIKPITGQLENSNPTGRVAIKDNLAVGGDLSVTGSSTLGDVGVLGTHAVDFGSFGIAPTKAANAGKIKYNKNFNTGRQSLDIYGGGTAIGDRLVNIYDNLNVGGTTTANTFCTTDGSCTKTFNFNNGGTNLPDGSIFGDTLFWNGTTWAKSSNLINYDDPANNNQYIQGSNLVTPGYVTLTHKSPDNSLQHGSLLASNSSLDITGVDQGALKLVTINDTLKTTNLEAGNYVIFHRSPDNSVQVGGIEASNYDVKISGVSANGRKLVTIDNTLNVTGVTQTEGFVMPTGAGYGKVFMSLDSNGKATWVATSSLGVTTGANLPDGTQNFTLYYNNGNWTQTDALNTNGTNVQAKNLLEAKGGLQVTIPTKGKGKILMDKDGSGTVDWVATSSLGIAAAVDSNWTRTGTNLSPKNPGDNVGIGTQTPGADLEVNRSSAGTVQIKTINSNTGNRSVSQIGAYNAGVDGFEEGIRILTTSVSYDRTLGTNDPAFTPNTGILRSGSSLGGLNISANSGPVKIFSGAKERVTIDPSGLVGIGTSTPTAKLQVNGRAVINGNTTLDNGLTTGEGARLVWMGGAGGNQEFRARVRPDGALTFFPGENTTESLILTNDSKVQIPTLSSGSVTSDNISVKALTVTNSGTLPRPEPGYVLAAAPSGTGLVQWTDPKILVPAGETLPTGTPDQTLRYNNGTWEANSSLKVSDAGDITAANNLTVLGSSVVGGNQSIIGSLNLGIFFNAPPSGTKLDVNGQIRIRGGNPGPNKILTSDADGLASWKAPAQVFTNYTAGTGISIDNGVITNTSPNVNQTLAISGKNLSISGANNITLPIPTYTFNNSFNVLAGVQPDGTTGFNVDIANGAITAAKIANGAIDNALKIVDGVITGAKIASNTITNAKIASKTITNASIADGTIVNALLGSKSVTNDKVAVNNLTISNVGTLRCQVSGSVNGNANYSKKVCSYIYNNSQLDPPPTDVPVETQNGNNYIFYCPAGYVAISGGAWCDTNDMLRENRPDDLDRGWRAACTSRTNGITTRAPDGAVLYCVKK